MEKITEHTQSMSKPLIVTVDNNKRSVFIDSPIPRFSFENVPKSDDHMGIFKLPLSFGSGPIDFVQREKVLRERLLNENSSKNPFNNIVSKPKLVRTVKPKPFVNFMTNELSKIITKFASDYGEEQIPKRLFDEHINLLFSNKRLADENEVLKDELQQFKKRKLQ